MLALGSWLSAEDIARLALPGLPADKRKVNTLILDERWATRVGPDGKPLCRKRSGRGGGYEWHSSLLPERARQELVRRGMIAAPVATTSNVVAMPVAGAPAAWAAFERLSAARKAEAMERLATLQAVEAHMAAGTTKTRAIALAAADCGVSVATINAWFARLAGVPRHDRLAYLAPDTKGGGKASEIDPELWDIYRSDWLRFAKPTHRSCYFRLQRIAASRGLAIPSAKTLQRKLEKEVPPEVILARREGREAVGQIIPAQIRTTAHLHAMHTVNIDGHVWDVRVQFPDGEIGRPVMVGIQDVYSRKLLAWRIDKSESAILTRLAFADLFKNYGIPRACVMDNGRAFASKWISGGTKTRYRFKIREDEPAGLLLALGIENRFATPYHGQAKPIERAWRDYCDYIARHPAFEGAYTGNSVVNKPENYGSRAIPLADFEAVLAAEIPAMNAKLGRRTENALGGSFDQCFERSIAAGAPVGRATEAQMRLALLAVEKVRACRKTGAVTFAGNRYWAEGMSRHAGALLNIRFDPDNLHGSVFAYDQQEQLLAELPVWEASGFDDMAAAKRQARLVADHRKAVKATVAAERLLDAAEVARALAGIGEVEPSMPEPRVLRPVRQRGNAAAVQAVEQGAFMDRFASGMASLEERKTSAGLRLVE